jgi:DNA-binding transcriptional ArsR family regulator
MELEADVASIAGLIGEPVRAAILAALVDGRALPAGELAFIGNVAPQTASFHLRKLLNASLISVERQGKHSYYRLTNDAVAAALEALAALGPVRTQVEIRSENLRESERVRELRFARSCYKHLAGKLAVEITQALEIRRFLEPGADRRYRLTPLGGDWLGHLGMNVPASAYRPEHSSRACIDWTERRHHLGGPLGVSLFSRLKELGWLIANPKTRAVRVTHTGIRELHHQLGVMIPPCSE